MSKRTNNQNNTEGLLKETLLRVLIQGSNSNSQVDINRLNQLVLTSSKTSSINSRASSTATSLAGSEVDDNFSDSDETNKKPKRKKVMETEQPKLVAVFHHFELVKNSKGKQKYKCKLCNCSRSGTNGSDSNLRTHIYHVHGELYKPEKLLYPSYLERIQKNFAKKNSKIDKSLKEKLHDAAVEAIVIDGRPHGDFCKPGMKQFLEIAVPWYKPQSPTTIKRKLLQK